MRRLVALVMIGLLAFACSGRSKSKDSDGARRRGAPPASPRPLYRTFGIGDKVDIGAGDTVQVLSYGSNVTPSNQFSKPKPGLVFAAIEVQGCAGQEETRTGFLNPFSFSLLMPDDSRVQSALPVKDPGLHIGPEAPGACTRGFVTYEIAAHAKPTAVLWDGPGNTVKWEIP